jgi:cell wall-associated protease
MKKISQTLGTFVVGLFFSLNTIAQVNKPSEEIFNWYNRNGSGLKTDEAYKKVANRKSQEVIVAVIDSGIDIEHEDLQGKIWINKNEIAGNGIDDDKNGYIDDIHGWNFLGNAKGETQRYARLEKTRIVAAGNTRFKDVNIANLSSKDKLDYDTYLLCKDEVAKELKEYKGAKEQIGQFIENKAAIEGMIAKSIGNPNYTIADLEKWNPKTDQDKGLKQIGTMLKDGSLEEQLEQVTEMVDYNYNIDYNDREFVGDDATNFTELKYGNADVEGPDALHGTHVGGIIAATRNNGIGVDGVAENVKLMSLRAVPAGDEQDKDIALAIRYAVDNGAMIINMSFGKDFSPNSQEVYQAFVYADAKGVLMIHAAGNDGRNLDDGRNFPTDMFPAQTKPFSNLLTIGASTRFYAQPKFFQSKKKKMNAGKLAADFSNYSQTKVDVFAPGHDIFNTVPQSAYKKLNGTSMASPMVAGVAAFLKSYFPELSMTQVKEAILKSATSYKGKKHTKPGTADKTDFGTLSVTGGIVNLPAAVDYCMALVAKK